MKISYKHIKTLCAGLALVAASLILATAEEREEGVEVAPVRSERLANVPGKALTAVTVNYAPGAKSKGHHHAGSVFAYVLKGAIRSENSATGPARVYQAGESFFEPANSKHLICENSSDTAPATLLAVFVADEGVPLTTFEAVPAPSDRDLAQEIFETMIQVHGVASAHRPVHAKGIVCEGSFVASKYAAGLSRADHFQKSTTAVTVRFSDGAPDPYIPDSSPNAGPRGMAIRFKLPNERETDIVAMSHNGFVVGTGEEFLELQKAIVATDAGKPHPWPVEEFLGTHPRALKFVQENATIPASFATESFFSNDSFVFINKQGLKQAGRYKILPVAGSQHLTDAEAKAKPENFLGEDLKKRLAAEPVLFRLVVQLPKPGDSTADPSIVWGDDRETIDMGIITVSSILPDNGAADKALAFDPVNLVDGIELSDDPLPALRSRVYALSSKYRHREPAVGGKH